MPEDDKGNSRGDPFKSSLKKRIKNALYAKNFREASNSLFGPLADKHLESFSKMREDLDKSGMNVLFRTYVSELFFIPLLVYFCSLISILGIIWIFPLPFLLGVIILVFYPIIIAILSFIILYILPTIRKSKRSENIDSNLPFALNHMAAVSSSGVTPSSMFKLLRNFEEYGEISTESDRIVRRMEIFGDDITTSLRDVAKECPSEKLKEILYGMLSTIETGGDLGKFLREEAKSSLFEYKMKMKREIESLATYASFYTAILVAAPLFLIFILSVLNMMGGSIAGMRILDLMRIGIYIFVPVINSVFLTIMALRKESFL